MRLTRHRFVQSVAFLQVANIIGNFVQAAIGIVIARILQPNLYGVYAVAFSLASLVYISTGVQETITVALGETYSRHDRERTVEAFGFFLRFSVLFALITLVITAFLPWLAGVFYHDPKIGEYAGIVIIASIISSFAFNMTSMGLQVSGDIKKMSGLILFDQVLRFSLSVILVALGYGIFGAALGHLIGAVIVFIVSAFVWKKTSDINDFFPGWRELIVSIRKVKRSAHLSSSLLVTVDKNIAMLYNVLPVLIIGIYLSRAETSFFKLSFGFVTLALSLLGPISTLLNSELSRIKTENPERLGSNFVKVSWYGVAISSVLTLAAIILGPFVFKILYGPSYLPSVKFIAGLFVYGIFYGIGVALGAMWRVVNRVQTSIFINLIVLGLGIPSGIWLIRHYGVWGGVIMVSAWFTISHLISYFYLSHKLRAGEFDALPNKI